MVCVGARGCFALDTTEKFLSYPWGQHVLGITRTYEKWSKGHTGCSAPGVDGGLRFPGHQDGLESFIARPCRPRSKTATIYFLLGEMQKSRVQRQLTQSHLQKINLLKDSISLNQRACGRVFSLGKRSILSKKKSATFCLRNDVLLNLIFPRLIPIKIANVSV